MLSLLFFALVGSARADYAGQVNWGLQYNGWQTVNTVLPFCGSEFMIPFSISYAPNADWNLYAQTSFATGGYTDSLYATQTLNLSALTASVVGTQVCFMTFGVQSMLEMDLTLPTGDHSWESRVIASNVPSIFINSRYGSGGWGLSGLYSLSFASGENVKYGVALGYNYLGPYDPGYDEFLGNEFKIGDSLFLALNRVETFPQDQTGTIRLTSMASLPTLLNGEMDFQMGPNVGASYSFNNPAGFSWEVGAQVFTLAQRHYLKTASELVYGFEPYQSSGVFFYAAPSHAFGNLTLGGLVKYVTANGYPLWDASGLYNGGGFQFALNPGYFVPLDERSAISFNGGFNYIIAQNAAYNFTLDRPVDLFYIFWTFGASYQIKI
jgi:hypothetical protein